MENFRLNFVIERNVPFIAGLLEPYANITYLAADEFTPATVKDADALIVRTRTHCDAALLAKSKCRFIGTATIGTDHIDSQWCEANGITVINAPGCNAPAVAQYVFGSIMQVANRPLNQYTIGIVGVGHVGSIVERWAKGLGMNVMVCDPPRMRAEGGDQWSSLAEIAEKADIITFHTPLIREGDDATYHIADDNFFASLRRSPVIINSARGAICDTDALIRAIDNGWVSAAVVDCWEGEPDISLELLKRAAIATPHIAGYSHDGKVRATQMILDAITTFFYLPRVTTSAATPKAVARTVKPLTIAESYNPLVDTIALKNDPSAFETLRNNYRYRSELSE
ncbi:MAG: 4-phosphoerythronate dehydrogenase [Muribaculaceae bacterium]|nr:4-phosphoerythronate dehydrogenase [Muribaculaceae bacterium]